MLNSGENERIVVVEDILDKIESIEDTAIEVAVCTFVLSILYMLIFCCKSEIQTCIIETGNSIPLFILFSTISVEVKDRVMFTKSKIKKLEREAINRGRAKGIAEGKAEGIAQGKAEGIIIGAKQKHEEWVEWADNGREEEKKPLPPESPK